MKRDELAVPLMRLAKPYIDVGMQTNQRERQCEFWGETVGLAFESLLKVGGGAHQLRHGLNGSVFKLNHLRQPLPSRRAAPTGYQGLIIAVDYVDEPTTLFDPDGNRVTLVPVGYDQIDQIAVEWAVTSLDAHQRFCRQVLGAEQVHERCFLWGETRLYLSESANQPNCDQLEGIGFRYLTVQVFDVDHEHHRAIELGAIEGSAVRTLGETARISFIRDPDGNWIEISQRASLTGPLPK